MELSFQLQTLEPLTGALDIIRYLGSIEAISADADEIGEALDLSERTFSKAIKRLVTKGYVQMDNNRSYRLTEQGNRAVEELAAYDESAPERGTAGPAHSQSLSRRLVLAVPRTLVAGQPAAAVVGFHPASDGQSTSRPADMVVRLSAINGEPKTPEDTVIELADEPAQHTFRVKADAFSQMRIKVQVFQLGPNPDDISVSGGMYVDVDVQPAGTNAALVAYGTDVTITPMD
jgi:DNA-binding MarR family transcriptional regulator